MHLFSTKMIKVSSIVFAFLAIAFLFQNCSKSDNTALLQKRASSVTSSTDGSSTSPQPNSTIGQIYISPAGLNCGGDTTIQSWYKNELDRCADSSGLAHWTNQKLSGKSYSEVKDLFMASRSYIDYRLCRAEGFSIELCYETIGAKLCNNDDTYTPATDQCTVSSLRRTRSKSPLAQTCQGDVTIQSYFKNELDRCADVDGLKFWSDKIVAGKTYAEVLSEIQADSKVIAYKACRASNKSVENCYKEIEFSICNGNDKYIQASDQCISE